MTDPVAAAELRAARRRWAGADGQKLWAVRTAWAVVIVILLALAGLVAWWCIGLLQQGNLPGALTVLAVSAIGDGWRDATGLDRKEVSG